MFDTNFDYQFYLLENTGIATNEAGKKSIIKTLKNLELFKSINSKEYCKTGIIKYTVDGKEAEYKAANIANYLYESKTGNEIISKIREKFITLNYLMRRLNLQDTICKK